MESIFFDKDKFFLNSFLREENFARTDLEKLLTEEGFIAEQKEDGTVSLKSWYFNSIKIQEDKTAAFEGSLPEGCQQNARTLYSIFENPNEGSSKKIIAALNALDKIIQEKILLCAPQEEEKTVLPGAQGIIVCCSQGEDKTQDTTKVLVLPGNLFERCAENSKDYGKIQGIFNHRGLEGLEAAVFTRSALAYRAVTGQYAFTEENLEKRQADFTDSNFIPVEYQIPGIEKSLAATIDAGLCVKRKKRPIPGERRFTDEKFEKLRTQTLSEALKLSASQVEEFFDYGKEACQTQEFQKSREEFIKKQAKTIKARRFYRRNSKRIWGGVLAVIAALSITFSFSKENQRLATSTGLTSAQTVQTLMTAIHNADVTVIQEIAKGRGVKDLIQSVSGFYVTNKQRLAQDVKDDTLSPAGWLFFKGKTEFWQYGITNLFIDGSPASASFDYPRRKDKKQPLTEEDGRLLKKGDTQTHEVRYDLVYNEGESILTVLSAKEKISLEWNGKRWIVRSITGTGKTERNSYRVKTYRKDYLQALEQSGEDIKTAAGLLRQKYSFAPSELDLQDAAPLIVKKFNNSDAKKFQLDR